MARWRAVLGFVVGAFMLLSAFMHSIFGGGAMQMEMTKAHVPEDLFQSLRLGWYLGGLGQLVFGAITVWSFRRRFRGSEVSLVPTRFIAIGYVVFAALALPLSGYEPFFLIMFGLPGILLAVASAGSRPAA